MGLTVIFLFSLLVSFFIGFTIGSVYMLFRLEQIGYKFICEGGKWRRVKDGHQQLADKYGGEIMNKYQRLNMWDNRTRAKEIKKEIYGE